MTPSLPYPSFSEVRRNLDPCCSYLVLECADRPGAEENIAAALAALPIQAADVMEKRLCRDADHRRLFLVVRLNPEGSELDREQMLSAPLSADFALLYYRKSADGGDHGVERF